MQHKKQIYKKFGADVSHTSVPFSVRATQRVSTRYVVDCWDTLENLTDVEEALFAMSIAEEHDEVVLNLNCDGGSHYVGDAIIFAMMNCRAPVHVVASGRVASYGTFILLSASSFEISPFTDILCHSASFGWGGKMQDTKEAVEFQYSQAEKMIRYYYKHFMTEEEINRLIHDKYEHFMTVDEFIERFERRNELMNAEMENSCECGECEIEERDASRNLGEELLEAAKSIPKRTARKKSEIKEE